MSDHLRVEVVSGESLSDADRRDVISLCNRAYEEDLKPLLNTFVEATHVLGFCAGSLVSHAMWVTRWLQPGSGTVLRTAYVEMVATEPEHQQRGFATEVMKRLAEAVTDYELGALCPAEIGLYSRLGWVLWRGPLFIRMPRGLSPTPDERVMILHLPKTPPLDLHAPLSAEWRPGELW
jgi:aminoglycoside 2'-N-acetyltransferase I